MTDTIPLGIPGLFGPLTLLETALLDLTGSSAAPAKALAATKQLESTADPVETRLLRAAVLRQACLDRQVAAVLGPSGLTLANATVEGDVDLAFATLPFPLTFRQCVLGGTVNLQHARLSHLSFYGGELRELRAGGLCVDGDLVLTRNVKIPLGVELRNARIQGDLAVYEAVLGNGTGHALVVDGARIRGALTTGWEPARGRCPLPTLHAQGCVSFCDTVVQGNIELQAALLEACSDPDTDTRALVADRVVVHGSMHLSEGFRSMGDVKMVGCRVRKSLVCSGGRFTARDKAALTLDNARIGQALFLNHGYFAKGKTRLVGAHIGSDLDCRSGRFWLASIGDGKPLALSAGRIHVGGDVYLDGARAVGELSFSGARLRASIAAQSLWVVPAAVQGNAPAPICLNLKGAHIGADVKVKKGRCAGLLELSGADVGSDVTIAGLRLGGTRANGIHATGLHVKGRFVWQQVTATDRTEMVLSHASIGRISHACDSWPRPGHLHLTGCSYSAIEFPLPVQEPKPRLVRLPNGYETWSVPRTLPPDWVALAPVQTYEPQPYEQLERVLLQSGHEDLARQVGIEKHEARIRSASLRLGDFVLAKLFGGALRHGYDSRPLAWSAAAIFVLGIMLFGAGHRLMAPISPEVFMDSTYVAGARVPRDYPRLNVIAYSLDTFLPPVIDFHQESHWMPDPNRGRRMSTPLGGLSTGGALRGYLWVHIGAGWVVTTLLLVNLSGLIRKR
jgi:hypothetical protein